MRNEINKYGIQVTDNYENINLIVFPYYNLDEVFLKLREKYSGIYDLKYKNINKREIILYKLTKFNDLPKELKNSLIKIINSGNIIFS